MPCYNTGKIIFDTLESLEMQSFQDFELICINDGSTDNTLDLLYQYKQNSKLDITIFDQENSGVSKTRNNGIEFCNGEFIVFVDSDDILNKDFLKSLISVQNKTNTDTVYCEYNRDLGVVTNIDWNSKYEVVDSHTAMSHLMHKMGVISFCCYLYKRSIIESERIRFDKNTKHFEDREFNWKYLCNCRSFAYINTPLYGYRNTLLSASNSCVWRTDSLEAVIRIENYLLEKKCSFYKQFKEFMFDRVLWGIAKKYAAGGRKDYFMRLRNEYDVTKCMYSQTKNRSLIVRLLSYSYLISPSLFYIIIKILSR